MRKLADGGYAIDDRLDIDGEGSSFFVFARGWLLEIVEIGSGEYYFLSDGREVHAGRSRFGVFYPHFTITRPFVKNVRGTVSGVGSTELLDGLPRTPFLFETDLRGPFDNVGQAIDILSSARDRRSIEVNTSPSLLSIKAKRLIDENYSVYPSIARIAARLNVSPAHLSRQFKRDYGLAPSGYLHQLRVADATHRLSTGEDIVDISQEVGYNDLSRFYKQFRKSTRTSPAACRDVLGGSK